MEELKNIRHFEEFKDALNEELLWGAVKNLFSKLFGKIDKKLADAVANFTKKLDASKDWNDSVRIFEQSTKDRQAIAAQQMQGVTGPLGLRKVLHDNASVVFVELQEMSNKYQTPALMAKTIFKGQPEEQMFNFDKAEDFTKNALNAVNAKIMEINKQTQAYKNDELDKYLKANVDVSKVETAPTTAATFDNYTQKFSSKLFEQLAANEPNRNPAQPNTPNPPKTDTTKTTTADPTTTNQGGAPQGDVNKLKQSGNEWMTNNLYGYSLKKLKEVKPPAAGAGGADPFDAVAKNTKATTNTQNLSKLLRNIVNLPDKDALAKVRDAIATAQGKDPAKFKEEIGGF